MFEGGVKASDYGSFLNNLLFEMMNERIEINKCFFYMDNAPIHHAKIL